MLADHRYAVDVVSEGATGVDMATQWSYDLILLDVLLPTISGIEVCRRLRSQNIQTPILILTNRDSNEDIIAGLDAGADDYVTKSCESSQILARVRALLRRGGGTATSPVLQWENLCLDPALARVTYNQQIVPLRPKEYTLLELFLRHPQRLFSRGVIIDHLWSLEETPVEGSVTNLIKDLRRRLKASGMSTDLIETVYGLGYRLKTPPASLSEASESKTLEVPLTVNALTERPSHPPFTSATLVGSRGSASAGSSRSHDQRGKNRIQAIADRFQGSLTERIMSLQTAAHSFQAGSLSLHQQKLAQTEAHKLAGGLGTFGYSRASEIAQAIEALLESNVSQEIVFAHQFSQLLAELQEELAQTHNMLPLTSSTVGAQG